ncbi:acylphosphatase [Simiduia aestuariiviva]|nr:acylphosphatase [Simiduia aestuariiviva]
MLCKQFVISGTVQGVYYRASCLEVALALSLTGWVRNLPNGQVEAFACGNLEQLDQFESWLHKGPITADVTSVIAKLQPTETWSTFTIR